MEAMRARWWLLLAALLALVDLYALAVLVDSVYSYLGLLPESR